MIMNRDDATIHQNSYNLNGTILMDGCPMNTGNDSPACTGVSVIMKVDHEKSYQHNRALGHVYV